MLTFEGTQLQGENVIVEKLKVNIALKLFQLQTYVRASEGGVLCGY